MGIVSPSNLILSPYFLVGILFVIQLHIREEERKHGAEGKQKTVLVYLLLALLVGGDQRKA